MTGNQDFSAQAGLQQLAQEAARLGEAFILACRRNELDQLEGLLVPGSPAAYGARLFGPALSRLVLRLDDPREQGRLVPYDLQLEPAVALLELGVISHLPPENSEPAGEGHLFRLFGSSLVLRRATGSEYGWLVEEVLPVNAGGQLRPGDPADDLIVRTYQGQARLPFRLDRLDPVERLFLENMANQADFNLDELINAARLWQDFSLAAGTATPEPESAPAWAAGVEYLITLFDRHTVEVAELAGRYGQPAEVVTEKARELAFTLRATQFDDRYSIHPDPIAHYRAVFGEIGIDPTKDEKIKQSLLNSQVFDSIEVPPDEEDFFGPPDKL